MKRICAVILASCVFALAAHAQSGEPVPRGARRLDAGRFTVVAFPSDLTLARALLAHSNLSAREIVQQSLEIAGDICIYTNKNITILEL